MSMFIVSRFCVRVIGIMGFTMIAVSMLSNMMTMLYTMNHRASTEE